MEDGDSFGGGSYPEPPEEKTKTIKAKIYISYEIDEEIPAEWDENKIEFYIKEYYDEFDQYNINKEKNKMNNELIILEQLPIIKYHLEQLSIEIKEKVDRANSLYVGEDTVKDVKKVRADLNKEFNELETQRKQVKQAIMAKYDEFEEIYKENVSNLYKEADTTLKAKIDSVENQLKQEKEDELREFVKQHIEANNLQNIINFEDIGLNITLSASMKSLKEQALEFINTVSKDIECINSDENRDELLYQYLNNGYDYSNAVLEFRKKQEELNRLKELQKQQLEEQDQLSKVVNKVEEIITAPKEVIQDDEVIKVSFTLTGTKEQIKKIKDLIIELGIEYE